MLSCSINVLPLMQRQNRVPAISDLWRNPRRCAGYTYHLIHIQPRPVSDTRLTSDADSSMSIHVQHTLEKDQV